MILSGGWKQRVSTRLSCHLTLDNRAGWWGSSYTTGYERETTTDADGNYSFSGLPDESFTVHVTADGYYSSRGIDSAVELTAVNDDNLKYVRVLDGDGTTLRDAEVMLYEAHTTTWTSAQKLSPAADTAESASEGSLLRLSIGVVGLLIGAHLTIEGAVSLAAGAGIPELVIGLTVVAGGTSLPELDHPHRKLLQCAVRGNVPGRRDHKRLGR